MKALYTKALAIACGIATIATSATTANAQTIDTSPFTFTKTRPRLVVLLHGVTPEPAQSPEQYISHPGHARHYWGFDFIKALQGKMEQTEVNVITPTIFKTLRIRPTTREAWQPTTTDVGLGDLAPIVFPKSWLSVPSTATTNTTWIKDYINLNLTSTSGADTTMVMINTRNGSKHLMPQVAETIEEVYLSYQAAFGHLHPSEQPQIYLVGHSFGGIIARAILANPTGGDLWGNKLTAKQREMCNYLRKRVVLVHTLSSPHEGTIVDDPSGDFADYVDTFGYTIVYGFLATYNWATWGNLSQAEIQAQAKDVVKTAMDAIAGRRDCLQDLRRMPEYNAGILKADTARRWDNGPLVPIYTAAGRNPGSTYYDQKRSVFLLGGGTYNPVSVIDLIKGTRGSKEASALYLINNIFHLEGYGNEGKMPWGTAEHPDGDRTSSPFAGIGPHVERPLADGWFPDPGKIRELANTFFLGKPYESFASDGEWDSDGFLAWDSAHAYHIPNQNFYRVYETSKYGSLLPWDVDNHGSLMFNPGNGAWIHNELLRDAGPLVTSPRARRSIWPTNDVIVTPYRGIKVEVLHVEDPAKNLDYGSGADFRLSVRMGGLTQSFNLAEGDIITTVKTFTFSNYASTIIPIRVSVIERDNPSLGDPDDLCVVSPTPGQTSMYLYFDTRTNRVMGDVNGLGGQILTVKPVWWGVSNRVNTKIRITRIQ